MAASIRLCVGLGGADGLSDLPALSCSDRRVLPCLITLGTASTLTEMMEVEGS